MKTKISFAAIVLTLLVSGCIPSLHPLYTAQTIILNENLNGNWSQMDVDQKITAKKGQNKIKIVGKLNASDEKNEWQFKKSEKGNYYKLTYFEDGVPATFDVHLVKLGEHLFFDFYPNEEVQKLKANQEESKSKGLFDSFGNSFQAIHYQPVHTFAKVKITEDQLEINQFNAEWIQKLFTERKIRIKHESTEHGIVLTASTKDLQKFVTKYAEEEEAFTDTIILKKTAS